MITIHIIYLYYSESGSIYICIVLITRPWHYNSIPVKILKVAERLSYNMKVSIWINYIYSITLKNNLISSVPAVAGAVQVTVTELFELPLLWVTYNNRYTVATRYNVLTVDEPPQLINCVPAGRLEKVPIRVELPDWRAWIMRPLNCLLPSSRTTYKKE